MVPAVGLGVGDAWGSRKGEIQGLSTFLVLFFFYLVCYYQMKVGTFYFFYFYFFLFFCLFVFLGLHPQYMEVPRLGVQSEL